jgi:ubiquinone/menaquinone biosynthesis C-methylase UbiE
MMAYPIKLDEYKQEIADSYDRRSQNYDDSDWHVQICHRLLEYAQVSAGQNVLDIGTGTGHLAIAAAHTVGAQGRVVGIDISAGMLAQAHRKVDALGLCNIELQLADAELIDYPINTFDHILCANTFPWLADKAATLQLWQQLLKPGGQVAIHTPADTAYIGAVVLRRVLAKHGISLEASNRIGSIQQCQNLFTNAGFENIEIKTEQHGNYTNLNLAIATWTGIITNPSAISLRISDNQLSTQLFQIKTEFEAELAALQTPQGIWDDLNTLYILAHKPQSQAR